MQALGEGTDIEISVSVCHSIFQICFSKAKREEETDGPVPASTISRERRQDYLAFVLFCFNLEDHPITVHDIYFKKL